MRYSIDDPRAIVALRHLRAEGQRERERLERIAMDDQCYQWGHVMRRIVHCSNLWCPGNDPDLRDLKEMMGGISR